MNSFTLTAIGNLAKDPEMSAKDEALYTRFRLLGSDYSGKDGQGVSRVAVTGVQFVAFGPLAEIIALNARKGDQLIVIAQMRADTWVDREREKRYGYSFVVQEFKFGAPGKIKRDELASRQTGETETEPEHIESEHAEPNVAEIPF